MSRRRAAGNRGSEALTPARALEKEVGESSEEEAMEGFGVMSEVEEGEVVAGAVGEASVKLPAKKGAKGSRGPSVRSLLLDIQSRLTQMSSTMAVPPSQASLLADFGEVAGAAGGSEETQGPEKVGDVLVEGESEDELVGEGPAGEGPSTSQAAYGGSSAERGMSVMLSSRGECVNWDSSTMGGPYPFWPWPWPCPWGSKERLSFNMNSTRGRVRDGKRKSGVEESEKGKKAKRIGQNGAVGDNSDGGTTIESRSENSSQNGAVGTKGNEAEAAQGVGRGTLPEGAVTENSMAAAEKGGKGGELELDKKKAGPVLFGEHLSKGTREKILKGEFIDIFTLLNREVDAKEVEKLDEREKELLKRKKPTRNWGSWLPAFFIYMGVIISEKPERALDLLKYLDLVYRAYSDFGGGAWLRYDEAFRGRAEHNPDLDWRKADPELWLQCMTPARPLQGDRHDSGHLVVRAAPAISPRVGGGQSVQPRLFCWEFNSHGYCSRRPCKYRHSCSNCGSFHPVVSCPRNIKPTPKEGQGGRRTGGLSALNQVPKPN